MAMERKMTYREAIYEVITEKKVSFVNKRYDVEKGAAYRERWYAEEN